MQILQFGAERVQMVFLFGYDILKHLVCHGVFMFRCDTRGFIVEIDGRLFELHGELQHLGCVGHLARLECGIHIHVSLQEEDPVGKFFGMPHFGDGHFAHDARKVPVAGILEASVEIHILESGGDFAPDGIVQQVDTYLILVFVCRR